jgi:hypothetical protein
MANLLDEVWRATLDGKIIGADRSKLFVPTHGDRNDVARARIAVLGKRAIMLLRLTRKGASCPTCERSMTTHTQGCAMKALLEEVEASVAAWD